MTTPEPLSAHRDRMRRIIEIAEDARWLAPALRPQFSEIAEIANEELQSLGGEQ